MVVESFQPVVPFWLRMDTTYGLGQVIASRTRSNPWRSGPVLREALGTEEGEGKPGGKKPSSPPDQGPSAAPPRHSYNTARGAATQEISGPFALPNATIRVLPLIADEETLNRFAGKYLNVESHRRFEAWGSHVYLIAYNYPHRSSEVNNVGLFAGRELNFSVPVKQYEWYEDGVYNLDTPEGRAQRDQEKLIGVSLVTPFAYVDDVTVAITSSEVDGVPTIRAEVGSPEHTWMDTSGPADWTARNLLSTSALVLPALGVGAGACHETFVQVSTEELLAPTDEAGWRDIARSWGPRLVADLERKYRERGVRDYHRSESNSFRRLRAQALEILTGKGAITSLTLKQFRDCGNPEEACYQALVQGRKTINRLHELCEIEEPLHVRITRYPTQPVAEVLGLCPKHTIPGQGVDVFEAVRPFWLRADLTEECGETLFERSGESAWEVPSRGGQGGRPKRKKKRKKKKRPGWRDKKRSIVSAPRVLNHIDRVHVPDLGAYLQAMEANPDGDSEGQRRIEKISPRQVGKDIGRVSPATILDSILSRQWGRPSHRRERWQKADFGVNVETLGPMMHGGELRPGAAMGDGTGWVFPDSERHGQFWPQAADYRAAHENRRKGLAWQFWDDVWRLIGSGDYHAMAREILPRWFHPPLDKKPGDWQGDEWREIARGLKTLVDQSHQKVDWETVIRPLGLWRETAERLALQLSIELKPDPSGEPGSPPNVAQVLRSRLNALANR